MQLEAEGLFRPELRKPLPLLPQGVGLITGADSDAQKDVVRNARLRWPAVRFVIRNTLVQGPHAVGQIVTALADLDADPSVDVIVLARGGGSLEDLLAFSDESLVRAVHAATTPVVSAIGHEADTPIVDLVADLRASTPTDAGKRIVPDAAQERDGVSQTLARIRQLIDSRLRAEETTLSNLMSRPVMRNPAASLALEAERIETMHRLLRVQVDRHLTGRSQELDHLIAQVRSLSPKATLDRGYAVLTSPSGEVRTSVSDVHPADAMVVRLADGELDVTVNALRPTPSSTSPAAAPDREQSGPTHPSPRTATAQQIEMPPRIRPPWPTRTPPSSWATMSFPAAQPTPTRISATNRPATSSSPSFTAWRTAVPTCPERCSCGNAANTWPPSAEPIWMVPDADSHRPRSARKPEQRRPEPPPTTRPIPAPDDGRARHLVTPCPPSSR